MGEVFAGRYELIDQIGLGGMGSIWRVRDLRTGGVVAAKVLRQLPDQPAAADLELLRATGATLRTLGGVLGILQQEPAGFVAAVRARMLAGVDLDPAEIEQLIDKRNRARADKDWATSDEVRDYLLAHGVALKDSPEGTTWEARER